MPFEVVAVIIDFPGEIAFTVPSELTVATDALDELQKAAETTVGELKSAAGEFEKAAELRDRIESLKT